MEWIAAASVLIGFIGSLVSWGSQSETNEVNRQIAQDTNAANAEIGRQQRAHEQAMYNQEVKDNIAFWNMQNEYNSPENQVARLRDAGLNPSLAMTGSNTAGSIASASHSMSNQAPAVGYQYNSPLGAGVNSFMQFLPMISSMLGQSATTESAMQTTDQSSQYFPLQFDILKNDKAIGNIQKQWLPRLMWQQYESQALENNLSTDLYDDKVKQYKLMTLQMKADVRLKNASASTAEILNKYVEPQKHLELFTAIEELALIKSHRAVNEKTLDVMVSQIANNYASASASYASANLANSQANLNNQQYQFNEETKDIRIDGMRAESESKQHAVEVLKGTIHAEIAKINMQHRLDEIAASVESKHLEIGDNDLNRFTRFIGDNIRNLVGGVLGGNVGYNHTNSTSTSHSTSHSISRIIK